MWPKSDFVTLFLNSSIKSSKGKTFRCLAAGKLRQLCAHWDQQSKWKGMCTASAVFAGWGFVIVFGPSDPHYSWINSALQLLLAHGRCFDVTSPPLSTCSHWPDHERSSIRFLSIQGGNQFTVSRWDLSRKIYPACRLSVLQILCSAQKPDFPACCFHCLHCLWKLLRGLFIFLQIWHAFRLWRQCIHCRRRLPI